MDSELKFRINELNIKGYRNLQDYECNFGNSMIIALLGNNGSGKSNVLEGIARIFYDAKYISYNDTLCDDNIPSIYKLSYAIDSNNFSLINDGTSFKCFKNNKPDIKNLQNILPKTIFTYYAGETKRLSNLSTELQDKEFDKKLKNNEDIDFKFITNLSLSDFSLVFLANYIFNTNIYKKIKNMLGIDSVKDTQMLIHFKKPSWASKTGSAENLWKATGFVRLFYNQLTQEDEEYGQSAFNILDIVDDTITLALGHIDLLKKIAHTPLEFYLKFKALLETDILQDIVVYVKKNNDTFRLEYFSEGEKQLANILLLLDLTKEYKALFLLDEFDAYLHPNWQRQFVQMIEEIEFRGQIVFTTHSPASISKINKENVFIMKNGKAYSPNSETYNRSLDEIMEENMEVEMRSEDIQKLIDTFRSAVVAKNKEEAIKVAEKLKEELSIDDPFLTRVEFSLERM